MLIILLIIIICYICGNSYINRRTLQTISWASVKVRITVSLLFGVATLLPFIIFAAHFLDIPKNIERILFRICSLWMVFVMYMTLSLLITDCIRRFIVPMFKTGYICALLFSISLLITGHYEYLHPQINRIDIATEKPIIDDTIKIVAVSDLHLGYGTGKERLQEFVKIINSEKPDVILIAGDLIDNNIAPLYEERMYEELNLLQAPLGIYMAPGNHEYISGIEESRKFVRTTSIEILQDRIITLPNGIQLLMRDDASNKQRLSIEELVSRATGSGPTILVDHQPREISIKDSLGIDLQISGHTHNGQVWPGNIIVDQLFEQSNGYRKWNHSHVYVSSGLSLWGPPIRIGTKGDIGVFNIYSTNKDSIRK